MPEYSKLYDRRTVDRYREKGRVSETDFEKHLKDLPDDAANAQYVEMDLHEAEIGEEGGEDSDDDTDTDTEEGA